MGGARGKSTTDGEELTTDELIRWAILVLMVEGHQQIDTLKALPVDELLSYYEGVQAIVNRRNALTRGEG